MTHHGDHQPNRKLGGTRAPAARRLSNDDAPLLDRLKINVVNMIAGLRDDAQIRGLLKQCAREARPLAVRDERVEVGDRGRFSEWLGKDLHLGPLAEPTDTNRSLIGMMGVVENRHTHRLAPKNRFKTSA